MKIKGILNLIYLSVIAVLTLGCEKEPSGNSGTAKTYDFTLEVESVSYNSAEISVQHNGPKDATWYLFTTTDIKKKDYEILSAKISELNKAGKVTGLRKTNNVTVEIDDLEYGTEYKVVVIAISKDCKLNQNFNMASITFKTIESIMEKKTDWSISYEGRTSDNCDSFAVQNENKDDIYVTFVNAMNIDVLKETEEFQRYGGLRLLDNDENVVALLDAEEAIVYMEMMTLIQYMSEGGSIDDIVYSNSIKADMERKQSGEYLAICIECNEDGPTGYYSCDYIEIQKETATAEYNRWIGTWKFKGSNNVEYTIELTEEDPNYIYAAKGWECDESLGENNDFGQYENLYIPMFFDKLTGKFYVKSYDWGQAQSGSATYWGLYGWYYNETEVEDDIPYIYDEKICQAEWSESGNIQLIGCKTTSAEADFTYKGMRYTSYEYQEEGLGYGYWNELMEFPITMTKVEANSGTSDAALKIRQSRISGLKEFSGKMPLYTF